MRQALLQVFETRHHQAHGATQHLGARRHRAARQVALRAPEVHPHVLEAGEEIRIARAAEADDVEERRQALVRDHHVEVLEVHDVPDRLSGTVVLPHFLGSVHAASLAPDPAREVGVVGGDRRGDRAAQQLELSRRRLRRLGHRALVVFETGRRAHLGSSVPGVHAFQAEAALLRPRSRAPK